MLTVLSDDQVRVILESLTLAELDSFREVLASALHEYSTSIQAAENAVWQLPHRLTTTSPSTGASTLFMPSSGPDGVGVKVVTLVGPGEGKGKAAVGSRPTGSMTLIDSTGVPVGFINATTLTAFRTALSSACLVNKRGKVKTIAVFGSGLQAYWHIRLSLKMRGSTIKNVYIMNRRFSSNAGKILEDLHAVPTKEGEGWANTKFSVLTPTYNDAERLQNEYLVAADVIFCCTPSTADLFDASALLSHEARKKGRLVVAVGSYTPQMRELPEGLLRQATKTHEGHRHFHRHAVDGGAIVVDTLDGALREAGEIVQAKIEPHHLVELGELVMLRRLALEESDAETAASSAADEADGSGASPRASSAQSLADAGADSPSSAGKDSGSSLASKLHLPFGRKSTHDSSDGEGKSEDFLARWLRDGNVIYKSVGFGLMDLVVASHVVRLAGEKKIGFQVEGF